MGFSIDELRKKYREMPIDDLALIKESYVESDYTPEANKAIKEILEERYQELEEYQKQEIEEGLKQEIEELSTGFFSREVLCKKCDFQGVVEAHDTQHFPKEKIFKLLGKDDEGYIHLKCPSCEAVNSYSPEEFFTSETKHLIERKGIGFLERLKNIVSGRIATSNRLFGNNAVRICEKLESIDNLLLNVLVIGTSVCAIEFLESMFFDVKDSKYADGTLEPNPFRENIDLLTPESSFTILKLVAGSYLVFLIARNYLGGIDSRIVSDVKNQFFLIYEYGDDDIQVFEELFELVEGGVAVPQLYKYIFEKGFKVERPVAPYHLTMFLTAFVGSFNDIFLPGLIESIGT